MNRSWSRNSSSSSGFVYFNKECGDSENFLSFQESPQKRCSNISPNYGTPMSHSSPRNFNKRNNYRYSGRNRGSRPYMSPNQSFKSWNSFNFPKPHHQKKISFNKDPMMSADGQRDMSMFYDHTCTWNPWEYLEKQLKEEKEAEEVKAAASHSVSIVSKAESKKDTTKEGSSSSSDEDSDSDEDTSDDSDKEEENETSSS